MQTRAHIPSIILFETNDTDALESVRDVLKLVGYRDFGPADDFVRDLMEGHNKGLDSIIVFAVIKPLPEAVHKLILNGFVVVHVSAKE